MQPINFNVILIIIFYTTIQSSYAARILCVFTTPATSHLIIHKAFVNGLVERGHNVTMITVLPIIIDEPLKYEHILLDLPEYQKQFKELIFTLKMSKFEIVFKVIKLFRLWIQYSAAVIKHEMMQKIMKEREYDLVVLGYLFNEVEFGIAAHFKCPLALVWINHPMPLINKLIGMPEAISYIPSIFLQSIEPMNFQQRILNSFAFIFGKSMSYFFYYKQLIVYNQLFSASKDYSSFDEMLKNVSIVMAATHFTDTVRPTVPGLIEIGGIQVKDKPNPLPSNLKFIFDNSDKHGVILFSLGSLIKSASLDTTVMKSIFKILSKLPQKVIWKWDNQTVPGQSENIYFEKWLPQDDILAHPKTRLFISHGGLGSIVEAKYHGVPILGIPIFGDQAANVETIRLAGWATVVDLNKFSEKNFTEALEEVLHNSKYRDTVRKISKIYRDRPLSAMENAMFWTEYVIRHKGAPHLQSQAVHTHWFVYYSLDVYMAYLIFIYLFFIISKLFIKVIDRLLFRKLFRKNVKKDKKVLSKKQK